MHDALQQTTAVADECRMTATIYRLMAEGLSDRGVQTELLASALDWEVTASQCEMIRMTLLALEPT